MKLTFLIGKVVALYRILINASAQDLLDNGKSVKYSPSRSGYQTQLNNMDATMFATLRRSPGTISSNGIKVAPHYTKRNEIAFSVMGALL